MALRFHPSLSSCRIVRPLLLWPPPPHPSASAAVSENRIMGPLLLLLLLPHMLFFFATTLLILRPRNADVRTPRLAFAVAAATMFFVFHHMGGDKAVDPTKASYFTAYALFIAGVALLFVRVWRGADRQRPGRAVSAQATVIAMLIAKLAVAALFPWIPAEEANAEGRINSDDVSMLLAASIVFHVLAQIL